LRAQDLTDLAVRAAKEKYFERSGLISLDGFASAAYTGLFAELERAQSAFLARDDEFRSPQHPWARDLLHEFSRCWEYPYVLAQLLSRRPNPNAPSVLDLGSGVTFFPFVLAGQGWNVTCVDNDPFAVRDVVAAAQVFGVSGRVRALQSDGSTAPLDAASVDTAYSISVLEHVSDPVGLVREVARVLRSGGIFVLTMDVDLKGDGAIAPDVFDALMRELDIWFVRTLEERTVHPRRVLDTFNSPFPRARQKQVRGLMLRRRNGVLLPVLGGPFAPDPVHLACYVGTFTRRS